MKIEFSDKELNYIEMALIERANNLEKFKGAGNTELIRKFTKRTYNRIRKIRFGDIFSRA